MLAALVATLLAAALTVGVIALLASDDPPSPAGIEAQIYVQRSALL